MTLSIIILSWNTSKLLIQCIKSLVSSIKYQVSSIEIIIVDNASTDGSVEDINKLTKLRIKGLTIKSILNKENLGFAKAVNQGIRISKGDAILLLNSDTIVKEGTLEELYKFEHKVKPAVIGAKLANPDGSAQASVFHLPTFVGAFKEYWLGQIGAYEKYIPLGSAPVRVEAVSGGAMIISREVIEKIGNFDERYFFYFEDLDYCRRAKKFNIPVYYLPTAEIIHEHGASGRNLASNEYQWKRLIPSAKIYYGYWNYFWINIIIRFGNKWRKLVRKE